MASIYRKQRSPFWYIQYVESDGTRVNKSTGLRADDPKETIKARKLRREFSDREDDQADERQVRRQTGGWDFVPQFLEDDCHGGSAKTLTRYLGAWQWISLFLSERGIRHPRDVRFEHGQQFVDWRKGYVKSNGKSVSHNTAVLDLKIFGKIVQRAVAMGIMTANPLVRLGISKEDARETPEITKAEFDRILPVLEKKSEWMQLSFRIGRELGCRLQDTALARQNVDFERMVIHFPNPKGGRKKAFSVPLPRSLKSVLEAVFADGRAVAFQMPGQPSVDWREFFDGLGMKHLHFHCLRVTYVTGLARRGVPRAVAMRLLNHGSELVHRLYQRLNVDDLRAYVDTGLPTLPAPSGQTDADASG